MGALKTLWIRLPAELPPLLASVLDSVTEEAFCSEQTIGAGPSWDVYHTEVGGRFWTVAMRAVDHPTEPYVEYLLARVASCDEALPKWRAETRGRQPTVH